MLYLIPLLLLACPTKTPTDSGYLHTGDTGTPVDTASADTGSPHTGDTPPPDTGDSDTGQAPTDWAPFGLLTLNLHCLKTDGTRFATNEERFDYIAQVAVTWDVGAMVLQEACEREGEVAMDLLVDALARAGAGSWSGAWVASHMAWEGTEDEALEGVGILARSPSDREPWSWTYVAQGSMSRVLLGLELAPGQGSLALHSVHLDHMDDDARALQGRETASIALSASWPTSGVVLAGDFNDTEESPALLALEVQGFENATRGLSGSRIDHVAVHRGARVLASDARPLFDGTDTDPVSDHDGYLVRLSPGPGEDAPRTRLVARYDAGWGHTLSVRGDTSPLSWDQGLVAWPDGADAWSLVLTEIPGSFLYKWLVDDTTWQQGDDVEAQAGQESTTTPSF